MDDDAVDTMLLFDCLRSGRSSWTLVRSIAQHDFTTAGVCVLGFAARWTLKTSLLVTLIGCVSLMLAKWLIDRRLRRHTAPAIPTRGIRLTFKTSSWNLIFAVRGARGGRYHRWHCLLRVRSLNREQAAIPQEKTPHAEGLRPGVREIAPLMEEHRC